MDRDFFDSYAKPFFDNGLMYEIYSSDLLSICNVANQCYAVFNFIRSKKGPAGLFITAYQAEQIANDNAYMLTILNMDREKFIKRSFALSEKNFKIFKEFSDINKVKGPSINIDYEMEGRIQKKIGGRGRK